jgi:hypothetical protein
MFPRREGIAEFVSPDAAPVLPNSIHQRVVFLAILVIYFTVLLRAP